MICGPNICNLPFTLSKIIHLKGRTSIQLLHGWNHFKIFVCIFSLFSYAENKIMHSGKSSGQFFYPYPTRFDRVKVGSGKKHWSGKKSLPIPYPIWSGSGRVKSIDWVKKSLIGSEYCPLPNVIESEYYLIHGQP